MTRIFEKVRTIKFLMLTPTERKKIALALEEDIGFCDITTEYLKIDNDVKAQIVAKSNGIIAGVEEACFAFEYLGASAKALKEDGDTVRKGDIVIEIEGNAKAILAAERTALNFLMRMSGIATAAKTALNKAREVNPDIVVVETRKGTPCFINFEKKAIRVAIGNSHRFRLDDCVLIKDNHIAILGLEESIKRAKGNASFTKKIEVEVNSVEQAIKAAKLGVDIIMLDNMKPSEIKDAVEKLEKLGLRKQVILEASGGITLDNIKEYAKTGVDVISLGYITHSAKSLDFSLRIVKVIYT